MLSPVTSTTVVTKGAEALAGSNLSARRMNGNIAPVSEPNVTTPIRAKLTVVAISAQWAP